MILSALLVAPLGQGSANLTSQRLSPDFSVSLPAKATLAQRAGESTYWRVLVPGKGAWVIGVSNIHANGTAPERILANMVAGYLKGAGGELTNQRDLVWQGQPALEFEMRMANGTTGRIRNYVVGNKTFQVAALSVHGGDLPMSKAVFDSVRFPGTKTTGHPVGPTWHAFRFPATQFSVPFPSQPKIQTMPLAGNPYGLVMHRAVSAYGNRTYVAGYIDIPKGVQKQIGPNHVGEMLRELSQGIVSGLPARDLHQRSLDLGGKPTILFDFKLGNGFAGRMETTYGQGRFYMVMAAVPTPLASSAEVAHFIGSLKSIPR